SGGPLVSLDGKVVGICAAIKSKNGGFQGVGLAIASNICKTVVTGLVNEGVVKRGYLGVHVRELTPALAAELKQQGVVIGEVYDKTPAAKAGLKVGDVITSFAGKTATDTKSLQNIVTSLPLNKPVQMTIIRNGKSMTVTVTIEELPGDYGGEPEPEPQAQGMAPRREDVAVCGLARV
ncbi:MAG TPA: PDZ domain-containing protein, partial [Gemmataceae bacterium]|nr:PDZ domain-containing protein [Gemmataceae bacterium]